MARKPTIAHPLSHFCRAAVCVLLPKEPQSILSLTHDDLIRAGATSAEIRRIVAAQRLASESHQWAVREIESHWCARSLAGWICTNLAHLRFAQQEELWVLPLSIKNAVLRPYCATRGTLTGSLAHPREVFAPAITQRAASIVTLHNHPSGSLEPSPQDSQVWDRMSTAGEVIGLKVTDDLIISRLGVYSRGESCVVLQYTAE